MEEIDDLRKIDPDPDNDDRTDYVTRCRMDELAASWHSAVKRLDARYRRIAIRQTITSILILGLLIFAIAQRRRTDEQSNRNAAALCALRSDLQRRVDSAEQFLIDHPKGIPGIPAATLRQQTVGQQRTIDALKVLRCA